MLPNITRLFTKSWKGTNTDMGNDNCTCLRSWPNSKTSMVHEIHGWAYLPNIVLHDIFSKLSPHDRLRASTVCRTWRQALYHPSFWKDYAFNVTPYDTGRYKFYYTFCHLVCNAKIRYHSLSEVSVTELAKLLQRMTKNYNIRSLLFEPTHCHMHMPPRRFLERCLIGPLMEMSSRLRQLSLGCCEDFCQFVPQILQSKYICPNKVELLGLASMKDDPGSYLILDCDPSIFLPFTNLQILSVDYDYVSDRFLESLQGASQLKRLIIHVHGFWEAHPGTTNQAWEQFVVLHPHCQLRLTLIHAYEAVQNLHNQILQPCMPLTHLKVFFCEDLNLTVFNLISSWYIRIFRSIMWVDSQSQETTWTIIRRMGDNHPDPLVMTAWLCPKLEEIVLLGYKYFEEDLIGIARLCESKLKRLEVADEDVIYSHEIYRGLSDSKTEITKILGRPWAPLQNNQLHPVICDPTAGDSDEYLLPIVLADLH